MSAFNRLPDEYLKLCGEIAKASDPRILAHRKVTLSPQNRRVRYAADLHLAGLKTFPKGDTRQQRRAASKPWKRKAQA